MDPSFPYEERARAALDWVARSIETNGGKGSSAYLFLGKWAPPYPETTGYLIETLLDYAGFLGEPVWRDLALKCGEWLLEVQHADGSFPSLYAHSGKPSIFNTGMILFGLARLKQIEEAKYLTPVRRAADWLLDQLDGQGAWPDYSYVNGYIPSYYTRVVWSVLEAGGPSVREAMQKALTFYAERLDENGFVKYWGFQPGKAAFTHTIAYTWRGFWESAHLLGREDILLKVQKGLAVLGALEPLPGRVTEEGNPDFSFSCLTGNVQLSILAGKVYARTEDARFKDMAERFFHETAIHQVRRRGSVYYGGIAGSYPIWGPYMRMRYPNWAVKFFLDACFPLWETSRLG